MLIHRREDVEHRIPKTSSYQRVLSFPEKTLSPQDHQISPSNSTLDGTLDFHICLNRYWKLLVFAMGQE
ncbi:hypothetical protein VNO77_43538 [Canavalia gladiata]|uniref:Uncharacterized protein n=1 Tax=Canavalia gladiata TaxID=3824 RepID=A0AAN9PPH8_CANGL